jgi:stage IV sporulation protein B
LRKLRKMTAMAIVLALALISATVVLDIYRLVSMPHEYLAVEGEEQSIDIRLPMMIHATSERNGIISLNGISVTTEGTSLRGRQPVIIETSSQGSAVIQFRLFGLIPLKRMTVSVIPPVMVIPGGQSIGVKLYTQGVLVVATADVTAIDGRSYNPAQDAGLLIGDSILEIDGVRVRDAEHVIRLLNASNGRELPMLVMRERDTMKVTIKPVKSQEDGKYRIGAWVRDKTAGVGTLSFYSPDTGIFGALGHPITDVDTGLLLSVEEGEILESKVASIQKGERSKPGEIRGIFFEEQNRIGFIEKNTEFGIYGTMTRPQPNPYYQQAIPVAVRQQVKVGKAHILTTVDEDVDLYEVEVQKLARQSYPEPKSMIIKVVDKRLLDKTGGIVQGMSGSPIIQDDRLIGVVTHVFVNDPTRGYGIYAEWMVYNAGLGTDESATEVGSE